MFTVILFLLFVAVSANAGGGLPNFNTPSMERSRLLFIDPPIKVTPEVLDLTLLPPYAQPKGTERVAVVRIYSPTDKPTTVWWFYYDKKKIKEEWTLLPNNEYEVRAFLGPIHEKVFVRLQVSNYYGQAIRDLDIAIRRDVEYIRVNHPNAFQYGSLAVVNYTLEFPTPILERIYRIDGVQFYLDEHEWKESNGKYTYFVVLGPVHKTHDLYLDVITADGTRTQSITKIILEDGEFFVAKDNFTEAKYGEQCNATTLCMTNKTDCDKKTRMCSCRQGYHWDSTSCKYSSSPSTRWPSITTTWRPSTVAPSRAFTTVPQPNGQDRDVKSIRVNHPIAFKYGSLAVVKYRLEFTTPILQRIYRIDGVQFYLDEHEWKESNGKYTYSVVFGPITKAHDLYLDVITADGPTKSVTKIILEDKEYFEAKVNFTGAKYGWRCTDTALCVTNKTDCNQKTGMCSCRQGYQWDSDSTSCKSSSNPSTTWPSITTTWRPSTDAPSRKKTIIVPQRNGQGSHIFIKTNNVNIFNFPVKQNK